MRATVLWVASLPATDTAGVIEGVSLVDYSYWGHFRRDTLVTAFRLLEAAR